jgi:hypothetical protein
MAAPTFVKKPLPILEGAAQLGSIKAQQAATELAEKKFAATQEQLDLANARQAEQDQIAAQQREFSVLTDERNRNEELLLDPNISEDHARLLLNRNNQITTKINPGSINIDPDIVLRDLNSFRRDTRSFTAMKNKLGEDNADVRTVFDAMKTKYMFDPARAAVITGAGAGIEEERTFERTEERRKALQTEKEEATTQALEGIEGLSPTVKAILPLVSSGKVSGAVLNILAGQTGTTARTGLAGVGPEFEGKRVTGVFDKDNKLIAQFEEAAPVTRREIVQERNMFNETITKGMFWTEDANGNPVVHYVTPQEVTPEGAPVTAEAGRSFTEKAALVAKLGAVGATETLNPETFLASAEITSEVTDDEIVDAYRTALKAQGAEVAPSKEEVEKKEGRIQSGKRKLKELSSGFQGLFGPQPKTFPKGRVLSQEEKKESAKRASDIVQKAATLKEGETLTEEEKQELQEFLKALEELE